MTTAGEGSAPTALDLLFGPNTDAAEALASEILSPGGDQNLDRALAQFPEMTRKAAAQEAARTAAASAEGRPGRRARARMARAPGHRLGRTADAGRTWQHRTGHRVLTRNHAGPPALRSACWWTVSGWPPSSSACPSCSTSMPCCSGSAADGSPAVRSGRCDITATLAVQGTDLLVRRAHLELPGVISLRRGIRLLPVDEYPAGEDPPDEYPGSEPGAGSS